MTDTFHEYLKCKKSRLIESAYVRLKYAGQMQSKLSAVIPMLRFNARNTNLKCLHMFVPKNKLYNPQGAFIPSNQVPS
jgi:hypothetical protein